VQVLQNHDGLRLEYKHERSGEVTRIMAHIKAHQSLSFFRVELSIDFAKPHSIRSIDFFRIDAEGTSYHTFQFSCQVLTLSLEEFIL
jgi:hypothetical protein